jgi:[protein-PII] uridylyltransferase
MRDVHALQWAEAAHSVLLANDQPTIDAAYSVLLDARVELQRATRRALNVLTQQDQATVAAALGDPSADVLMGRIAEAARTIAWMSDDTWRRIQSTIQGLPRRRHRPPQPRARRDRTRRRDPRGARDLGRW